MSRSGYSDDWDGEGPPPEFWRRAVTNAMNGKRGQAFLRELIASLDAMPEKRLIEGALVEKDGACCALGAVGKARCMADLPVGHREYTADEMSERFGIASVMAAEIMYENDDGENFDNYFSKQRPRTPEERWQHMRKWAEKKLAATT
jgi:hypothetical protein